LHQMICDQLGVLKIPKYLLFASRSLLLLRSKAAINEE
jgi:hypothetical protein